jgi:predicted nucleic acid-binding protein
MIGIDTGFFIELIKGNNQVVKIWNEILEGEDSIVSSVSLYELKKLSLKGSIDRNSVDTLLEAIKNVCTISWLDDFEIFMAAANLSHGLGLHMSNAFILSGLIKYDATIIYTVDPHLCLYKKKGVDIVLIKI